LRCPVVDEFDGVVTPSKNAAVREIGVGLDPHRGIEPRLKLFAACANAFDEEYFRVRGYFDAAWSATNVPGRRPVRNWRPFMAQWRQHFAGEEFAPVENEWCQAMSSVCTTATWAAVFARLAAKVDLPDPLRPSTPMSTIPDCRGSTQSVVSTSVYVVSVQSVIVGSSPVFMSASSSLPIGRWAQ
jgi:hypothetical protein